MEQFQTFNLYVAATPTINVFDWTKNDLAEFSFHVFISSYQIEAVKCVLEYIVKHSTKEKDSRKCRAQFIFVCMQRYINFAKDGCDNDRESLRSKIINCLENCGKVCFLPTL